MNVRGLFLSFVTCLSCATSDANAVTVRGSRSCGEWMEAHQSSEPSVASNATENWLIGYLSGLAVGKRKDFIVGTDNASLFLWVTDYCRANPLDYLDDAGVRLSAELARRKGL